MWGSPVLRPTLINRSGDTMDLSLINKCQYVDWHDIPISQLGMDVLILIWQSSNLEDSGILFVAQCDTRGYSESYSVGCYTGYDCSEILQSMKGAHLNNFIRNATQYFARAT